MMRACSALRRRRGFALIMAIVVVSLLTLIVVEFAYEMQVEAALANNALLDLQADYAARSAVNFAKALFRDAMVNRVTESDSFLDEWAKWTPLYQAYSGQIPEPLEVGDATVYIQIVDEDSKINVNRLTKVAGGGSQPMSPDMGTPLDSEVSRRLGDLYAAFGIDPVLVDMLADWIDPDEMPRTEFGSENDYYQRLGEVPYSCKNWQLDTIDEMLLIHGYNRRVMFGTAGFPGLQAYLTVFGGLSEDGKTSKINVNTATEPVLVAVLGQQYAYHVDTIISAQQDGQPFKDNADLRARLGLITSSSGGRGGRGTSGTGTGGVPGNPALALKTSSEVFSIDCLVEINDYSKRFRCVIKRKMGPSRVLFKTLMWKEQV